MSPWTLEPPRSWPGVLYTVPTAFQACVQEPAFILDGVAMVSACLWRQTSDDRWQTGVIDFQPAGRTRTAASGCWRMTPLRPISGSPISGSPRTTTSLGRWTWGPWGRSMRCGR
jgi:hypothetical protein